MGSSEPVEVLPPLQSSGRTALKHYIVRLQHATGIVRVVTQAAGHRAAISQVLDASDAPRSAVLSVQKFKWIEASTRTTNQTPLKMLKYGKPRHLRPRKSQFVKHPSLLQGTTL